MKERLTVRKHDYVLLKKDGQTRTPMELSGQEVRMVMERLAELEDEREHCMKMLNSYNAILSHCRGCDEFKHVIEAISQKTGYGEPKICLFDAAFYEGGVKMTKKLQIVIDHYGADHQLSKVIEEQAELTHVIARRLQGKEWDIESFLEEFADVYVIFDQLKLIYCAETKTDLSQLNNALDKRKRQKMQRTLQRMKEGK